MERQHYDFYPRNTEDIDNIISKDFALHERVRNAIEITIANAPEGMSRDDMVAVIGQTIQSSFLDVVLEHYPDATEDDFNSAWQRVNWGGIATRHLNQYLDIALQKSSMSELREYLSRYYDASRIDTLVQTKHLIEMMAATKESARQYQVIFSDAFDNAPKHFPEINTPVMRLAYVAGVIKNQLISVMRFTNPNLTDELIDQMFVEENWYEAAKYIGDKIQFDRRNLVRPPSDMAARIPKDTGAAILHTTKPDNVLSEYQDIVGISLAEIPAEYSIIEQLHYVADALQSGVYESLLHECDGLPEDDFENAFVTATIEVDWLTVASHHLDIFRSTSRDLINHNTGKPLKSTDDIISITTSEKGISEFFREIVLRTVAEASGTYNQYQVMELAGDQIRKEIVRIMMEQYGDSKEDLGFDLILVNWVNVAIHHARQVIEDEKPKGFLTRLFGR